jgi:N-acylneuraminate cytidylyltransferase|tara:strand:+ start:12380 stop:13108 length:729 start_codon:yes stop_codon:yes gene_type:complete
MKKVKVLALIPARAGSKGLKNKNVRTINKIPLIAYSILSAKKSRLIDEIIVTTDSARIASIAKEYGASVPFARPANVSRDDSTDYETIKHALDEFKKIHKYAPEIIVHLRPTSPHRPLGIIDKCIKLLLRHSNADSLRCVTECTGAVTPYKMWNIKNEKQLSPVINLPGIKEPFNAPRQSLPKAYLQTGTVDVVKVETILKKRSMTGDKILAQIVEAEYALDIDDEDDLKIMRAKLKNLSLS